MERGVSVEGMESSGPPALRRLMVRPSHGASAALRSDSFCRRRDSSSFSFSSFSIFLQFN
jgi:hypothetical protein